MKSSLNAGETLEAALQLIRSIGPTRLAAMGAVAVALVGFFGLVILRLSSPTMVALYNDLSMEDSASIVQELDSRGVNYELKGDGSVIAVPDGQVLRLRMDLAAEGLPRGGSVGYEIFDRTDTLGATSFVQNINHLRALEGELARTIAALDRVANARVHLVIPERQLFVRDQPEPTASIALKTRGDLSTTQVRAIQHLVAAAVQGLTPGRVSVVDDTGRLLADGRGDDTPGTAVALDERRTQLERQLRSQVEEIVSSIVGRDRVRVQVAADLDFSRVSETTDSYDPDGRVVRSTQTREDSSSSSEAANDGVTVGNELPDADAQTQADGRREESATLEEITNYEISQTTRTEVREAGEVKRLSVAVVVDGNYTQSDGGDIVYEPRSQDELDRIAALVRSAIGFDEARGDTVEIANLRFADAPQPITVPAGGSLLPAMTRSDVFRLAEIAVLGLLGLLVVLFVLRPLVRQILNNDQPATGAPQQIEAPGETADLLDHGTDTPQLAAPAPSISPDAIELAQAAGEVQASSLQKVGDLIEQHPIEAVSILRNWIHEPAT